MPLVAGKRRNVRFPLAHLKTAPLATAQQKQKQKQKHGHQKHNLNLENRLGNRSTFSTSGEMAESAAQPGIPALFTQPPSLRDPLVTETTDLQDATLSKCLPFLKGISDGQKGPFNANGVPALQRADHLEYLYDALEDYPAGFVAMDSSRPWMIYWGLAGLTLMGEDVTPIRERCVFFFFYLEYQSITTAEILLFPSSTYTIRAFLLQQFFLFSAFCMTYILIYRAFAFLLIWLLIFFLNTGSSQKWQKARFIEQHDTNHSHAV